MSSPWRWQEPFEPYDTDLGVGRMTGRADAGAIQRRNERLIGVGIVVGAAAAAIGTRYLARRAHQVTADGLVDWRRAEQLAVARLRNAPGALSPAELQASAVIYDSAMQIGRASCRERVQM